MIALRCSLESIKKIVRKIEWLSMKMHKCLAVSLVIMLRSKLQKKRIRFFKYSIKLHKQDLSLISKIQTSKACFKAYIRIFRTLLWPNLRSNFSKKNNKLKKSRKAIKAMKSQHQGKNQSQRSKNQTLSNCSC